MRTAGKAPLCATPHHRPFFDHEGDTHAGRTLQSVNEDAIDFVASVQNS
jgi:hypothetical protein